jgi:hypothetical protein
MNCVVQVVPMVPPLVVPPLVVPPLLVPPEDDPVLDPPDEPPPQAASNDNNNSIEHIRFNMVISPIFDPPQTSRRPILQRSRGICPRQDLATDQSKSA